MGDLRILAYLCGLFLCGQSLKCHYCKNSAPDICLDNPGEEECSMSNPVCYTKVKNDGGVLKMSKGCRNENYCYNNMLLQNRQGCASAIVKGQCYYHCCADDKCNMDDRRDYTIGDDCESWGAWSRCSRSCGYGLRIRTRQCIDYSQASVSGSKSKSKAKSIKCSSKSSKKSKSKSKKGCDYVNQYEYDLCNAGSCRVHECYSCNTSATTLPSDVWNCINNKVPCGGEEEHCLYSFWAQNAGSFKLPHLAKRCADKSTCDLYIGDLGLSGKCAVMVYELARDKLTASDDKLTISDIINIDDITTLVQRLEEPCHVCCKGALCNEGFLPAYSALYPAAGERVQLSAMALSTVLLAIFRV